MEIFTWIFGATLAISISGSLITGAILLLVCVFRAFQEKSWGETPSVLETAVGAFFIWVTLTSLLNRASGILEVISWQSAMLLFYLTARFFRVNENKKVLHGYVIAAIVAGFWGFLQKVIGINYDPDLHSFQLPAWAQTWPPTIVRYLALHADRAVGPRSHPLTYAESLMPAILVVVACLIYRQREKKNVSSIVRCGVGLVLLLFGLALSQSRGVWLGVGVGVLILSLNFSWRSRIILIGVATGGLCLILMAAPRYRARLLSIVSLHSGQLSDQQSSETRIELWRQSLEKIREKPVGGWGLKKAELRTINPNTSMPTIWTESHDIYLQTAMESGVVGLLLFGLIVGASIRGLFRIPLASRLLCGATLVSFLVAGLTESWTRDKEIAFLFWGFLGLLDRLVQENQDSQTI